VYWACFVCYVGVVSLKKQKTLGMKSLITTIIQACYSAFIIFILSGCYYSSSVSKQLLQQSRKGGYDIIIVPGVPFENETWGKTMKERVYWSKYLYDQGVAKNIMYSGAAVYTPYYEAEIMAMYAVAVGIPKEHVFTETKAEHSTENIYYSYKKAKKLGFQRVGLASGPFQTRIFRRFIKRRLNNDVSLVPIVIDTLKTMAYDRVDPVIDYQQAYERNFTPLNKRETIWKRLRGTLGHNLDVNAYE
jgi:uncharacterized SAM-binding protein YcdF (DUF218 family)